MGQRLQDAWLTLHIEMSSPVRSSAIHASLSTARYLRSCAFSSNSKARARSKRCSQRKYKAQSVKLLPQLFTFTSCKPFHSA